MGIDILISWFAGKEIVVGNLTTGQFTSMISYAMQILISLMILSMVLVMMMISRASAERIVEILDEESDIANKANKSDMDSIIKKVNTLATTVNLGKVQ